MTLLSTQAPIVYPSQTQEAQQAIVFQGQSLDIVVPKHALAPGSVQIICSSAPSFSQWQSHHHKEAYAMVQRIAAAWSQEGISHYMVYGKESPDSTFCWEVVPYSTSSNRWVNGVYRFYQQLKVLWNITFGSCSYSIETRKEIADTLRKQLPNSLPPVSPATGKNEDAFCKPEVIQRQRVFEGKEVNVLYDYAPLTLGKDRLHFLIVPKRHCKQFTELTLSEYLESKTLSQKLQNHFGAKGYVTMFQYGKTGEQAGQSIPHAHDHLLFTETKTQEWLGKIRVLIRMLFGSSPLTEQEQKQRVATLSQELTPVLAR